MSQNTGYLASTPANVSLGSGVSFVQQCIFPGLGRISIGSNVTFGYPYAPHFFGFHTVIVAEASESLITIGDNTEISNDVSLRAFHRIEIGSNCLIGDRGTIYDADMHEIDPNYRKRSVGCVSPVKIGNNVWIGSQVIILRGVTIGDNSVVAAGSIVVHSIPPNSVAAGSPAKVTRVINNV